MQIDRVIAWTIIASIYVSLAFSSNNSMASLEDEFSGSFFFQDLLLSILLIMTSSMESRLVLMFNTLLRFYLTRIEF